MKVKYSTKWTFVTIVFVPLFFCGRVSFADDPTLATEPESVNIAIRAAAEAANKDVGIEPVPEERQNVEVALPVPEEVARLKVLLRQKEAEIAGLKQRNEVLNQQMQRMLETNRKERALLCYNMGCVYKATKEFSRAEAKFLEAHNLNPSDVDVVFNLAVLYDDNLKIKAKAKLFYEKFLAMSSDEQDVAKVKEWLKTLTASDSALEKK